MKEKKYIYCENDIEQAIKQVVENTFGWQYELTIFFTEKVIKEIKNYTNLFRFYDRNCAGCVCDNEECDFAHGKGKAEGCWEKAKNGELFDCPVRVNGSMTFTPGKGFDQVDISDRNKPPYPIVKY